jgi:large subunit ribosomal protein L25
MAVKEKVVLEVERRTDTGKNACRRLRARGRIPGNVYGLDRPPFMVAVSPKRIEEVLRLESGVNTIFNLALVGEDRTREAMIKELTRDPLTEAPLHVDFVRVDPKRAIHVRIPIRLIGIATGVKNEGGIVDFVHREVQVECLPALIPEHLDVDVSELHLNQHVSIKDLASTEGVRILDDPEQIVAVVTAPRLEEVPVAAEAAPAVEGEAAKEEAAPAAGESGGKSGG